MSGISDVIVKRGQEVSTEVITETGTDTDQQETQLEQSPQHAERSDSYTQIEEEKDCTL